MEKKHFLYLLVLLHLLFMCKQLFFGNMLLQDSHEYLYAADNLIQHHTLYAWDLKQAWDPDWLSKRPILYPALLAFFRLLSFGSEPIFFGGVYLVQNLTSILVWRLIIGMAEKRGVRIHWARASLYALLSLSQLIYANMIMSEIWLQLCMVLLLKIWLEKPLNKSSLFQISMLLIAGLSLKPVLMFCVFLYPLIWLVLRFRQFRILPFAITVLPLLFYFSVSAWNQKRSGYFHYSAISNINLLHYNTYTTLMHRYGLHVADSLTDDIRSKARLQGGYREEQVFIQREAGALLKKNLPTYLWLHSRGIVFCLLDPGRFDLTQFFRLPHRKNLLYETNKPGLLNTLKETFLTPPGMVLLLLMAFHVFRALQLLKFLFSGRYTRTFRLILLAFPVYILALTGPIGASRFFMPVVPLVFFIFLLSDGRRKEKEGSEQIQA